MAKKTNENKKSLLSERMKKTPHDNNNGVHTQQTEINIFVSDKEQIQQNPQFNPNIQYQQPEQFITQETNYEQPNNYQQPVSNGKFHINNNPQREESQTFSPLIEQEYVFDAGNDDEMPTQEEYVSPFAKKKKKTKKVKEAHQYGENAISGDDGNPFAKQPLSKKVKLIILFSIIAFILIAPQLLFRIPAVFDEGIGEFSAKVTNNTKKINEYITIQNGTQDWDKDGLSNNNDKDVWNPDTDNNGIPDGEQIKNFIKSNTTVTYNNVTIPVDKADVGVSKFLNYYVFSNYKGWAKISNEKGIPYIYEDNGWTKAKYRKDSNTFYVYIPSDCYIEFVSTEVIDVYRTDFLGEKSFATKEARYVTNKGSFAPVEAFLLKCLLPTKQPTQYTIASVWHTTDYHLVLEKNIIKAEAVKPSRENYTMAIMKDYIFSYEKLYSLYKNTDNGKTTLISILTKDGEVSCYAYAYDYLGNIYLADAQTSKTLGKINIKPKAQIYFQNNEMYIREWYEFSGIGLSSENGDKLFIY